MWLELLDFETEATLKPLCRNITLPLCHVDQRWMCKVALLPPQADQMVLNFTTHWSATISTGLLVVIWLEGSGFADSRKLFNTVWFFFPLIALLISFDVSRWWALVAFGGDNQRQNWSHGTSTLPSLRDEGRICNIQCERSLTRKTKDFYSSAYTWIVQGCRTNLS